MDRFYTSNFTIRSGQPDDVDYLVWIRIEGQGELPSYMAKWTAEDYAKDRQRMLGFLQDADKFTYIAEDPHGARAGAIFGEHLRVTDDCFTAEVLRSLPSEELPENGLVSDIFELWVEPPHRRRGIASRLKQAAEQSARAFGCGAIYTHTADTNPHVVEMNLKLGYREVRRAPIWDEVIRVSLIKTLA